MLPCKPFWWPSSEPFCLCELCVWLLAVYSCRLRYSNVMVFIRRQSKISLNNFWCSQWNGSKCLVWAGKMSVSHLGVERVNPWIECYWTSVSRLFTLIYFYYLTKSKSLAHVSRNQTGRWLGGLIFSPREGLLVRNLEMKLTGGQGEGLGLFCHHENNSSYSSYLYDR